MERVRLEKPREETTTFFDVNEGRLIIGDNPELLFEEGVDFRDVIPLSEALTSDSQTDVSNYPKNRCDDWSREDYIVYARWLNSFVESPTPTKENYQRAFKLGIGPHPKRINRRFGALWQLHDEAELEGGFCRGKYSDWTKKDFLTYGQRVVEMRGGKIPNEATLRRHFKNRRGPSPSMIFRRFGSLRNFQEFLGFPNVHSWDKDDYIDYGVKVAEANDKERPSRIIFDELSKRKRGPTTSSIVNHFGRLSDFQDAVERQRYLQQIIREQDAIASATTRWAMVENGQIPIAMFKHDGPHDVNSFLQQTAIYLLASNALPYDYSEYEKVRISMMNPDSVIKAIRDRGSSMSVADMEVWASTNGLFEQIWPDSSYFKNLKV